jgi:Flp pilus assembly protein TadD
VNEGLASMERAYRMDPLSEFMLYNYAIDLTFVGQEQRAIELLRAALERAPGNGGLHCRLGAALFAAGRLPEARAALVRARGLMPAHHETCATLACVLAAMGEPDAAQLLLEETRWMAERGRGASVDAACAYHWLGDDDGAFRWLEHAVETREAWMVWLHHEPRLRRLHGDPRFGALLHRVGVVARR